MNFSRRRVRTAKSLPADEPREDFSKLIADYGVGAGVVVVVSVLVFDIGVDVIAGIVVVELDDEEAPPAGDGFTIVVLFSVAGAGEAPVVGVTSVRCSQAPRSAALARMQIIFFIYRMGCPVWDKLESRRAARLALPN